MTNRWLTLSATASSVGVLMLGLTGNLSQPTRGEDVTVTAPAGPVAQQYYDSDRPAVEAYYNTVREAAAGLPTHTVYRPANLGRFRSDSLPIVVWANGSCRASNWGYISTLTVLASHGFVVIAVGAPDASPAYYPGEDRQPERLIAAIDWAIANDGRLFRDRLDESKIALAGQSCGGVEAFQAAGDPRVMAVAAVNHAGNTSADLEHLHQPTMLVSGGPTDSAYERSKVSYDSIDVPAVLVDHYEAGHTGLWFGIRNGIGDTPTLAAGTELLTNWLDFTLNGEESARQFLIGPGCRLCTAGYPWSVQSKGFE